MCRTKIVWANLQKQVTVSSTSNGNIIWPLAERPWIAIDEYRTLDSVFDALLLLPPTMVLSTFDVHINDDLLSPCLRRELVFFIYEYIYIKCMVVFVVVFGLWFRSLDSFNTIPRIYSKFEGSDFGTPLIYFSSRFQNCIIKNANERKFCMANAWDTFLFSIPEKE